jgi:hypothetical protein
MANERNTLTTNAVTAMRRITGAEDGRCGMTRAIQVGERLSVDIPNGAGLRALTFAVATS